MRITRVKFKNFKPYCGEVSVDLTPDKEKNIILVGGENGRGKTSFLIGVVWCLYGKTIKQVDQIFKEEVGSTYGRFLDSSLNWEAKKKGVESFSIEIDLTNISFSSTGEEDKKADIKLIRDYNVKTAKETFTVLVDGEEMSLLSTDDEKTYFVNQYLVPLEIAKFVFFDAEKIAEIASLKPKDQALLINKAFGQILGLDTYEHLLADLDIYKGIEQKAVASNDVKLSITNLEAELAKVKLQIKEIKKERSNIEEKVSELEEDISLYTNELIRRGHGSLGENIDELREKEQQLNVELEKASTRFNNATELIPLSIIAHKLAEACEHIDKEEQIQNAVIEKNAIAEKTKEFTDKLFGQAPLMPEDDDINIEQRFFYYNKAKDLLGQLENSSENLDIEIAFEHDLDKSEIKHIRQVFQFIQGNSKSTFEAIFNSYMRANNDYQDAQKQLKFAESASKDAFVKDFRQKKQEAENIKAEYNRTLGARDSELHSLEFKQKEIKAEIKATLNKVQKSEAVEKKLEVVKRYEKTLRAFIKEQKAIKAKVLEEKLLTELKNLFQKKAFIYRVEVNILPQFGLEVKLFDKSGKEISQASDMSKGEQQLYISALLKAILSESVHSLPMLIDTPLGRLDQEHRNNILEHYYPSISDQVIIFSTDTEIRTTDFEKIKENVAKTYRLQHTDGKTEILEGYFEHTDA